MKRITLQIVLILSITTLLQSCWQRENMKQEFERKTGLTVVGSFLELPNNSDSFPHEGEHSIVFQTTEKQFSDWLAIKAPWNIGKWKKGSIPHNIGIACQFGFKNRVGVSTDSTGRKHYTGNKDLERLLNDTALYYAYRIDCCEQTEESAVSKGALLVLSPKTKTVYYSNWSY
jgi:hypothetical protein